MLALSTTGLQPWQPDALAEAGVDEAGRGALAGPVVAAAVVLPPHYRNTLLNDSKQLSHEQRLLLREEIMEHALAWNLGITCVAQIDQLNILQASFRAMAEALDGLALCPTHAVIDGHLFNPRHLKRPLTTHCVVKGDGRVLAVAAASILAKTFRDELMQQLAAQHPHYLWQQNMGYPTPAHRRAIREHGLSPWHRRSFQCLPAPALFEC